MNPDHRQLCEQIANLFNVHPARVHNVLFPPKWEPPREHHTVPENYSKRCKCSPEGFMPGRNALHLDVQQCARCLGWKTGLEMAQNGIGQWAP